MCLFVPGVYVIKIIIIIYMSNTNSTDHASLKIVWPYTVFQCLMKFCFLHRRYVRSSSVYDQLLSSLLNVMLTGMHVTVIVCLGFKK